MATPRKYLNSGLFPLPCPSAILSIMEPEELRIWLRNPQSFEKASFSVIFFTKQQISLASCQASISSNRLKVIGIVLDVSQEYKKTSRTRKPENPRTRKPENL